jgi:aspartate ammonia-lyase
MNSIGIVTFLNPVIGHHNGDLVGKECARTGKNVRDVVLDMGLLTAADLDEMFSPENLITPQYRGKVYDAPNGAEGELVGGPR